MGPPKLRHYFDGPDGAIKIKTLFLCPGYKPTSLCLLLCLYFYSPIIETRVASEASHFTDIQNKQLKTINFQICV
jgi:hypothetical protein